jgi:hypothetical protein
MRNLVSGAVLLVLLVVAGVMTYNLLSDDDDDNAKPMNPKLEEHLLAEARRLAADPDAIEQPDARWVAGQLGRRPTAKRLQELVAQRTAYILRQEAKYIQEKYPRFWNYQEYHASQITGSNGADALNEVRELARSIRNDDRFRDCFDRRDFQPDAETTAAFLAESQPVLEAARKALEADVIVEIHARMNSLLDPLEIPTSYYIIRVLDARARLQAGEGMLQDSQESLTVALQIHSRADLVGNLITFLLLVEANSILVETCVAHLPRLHEVPVEVLREWLELGKAAEFDLLRAFAYEFADSPRTLVHEIDNNEEFAASMGRLSVNQSVEEHFEEFVGYSESRKHIIELASRTTFDLRTPEGAHDAAEHLRRSTLLIMSNDRDCMEAYLIWAALELRILERESGPLAEQQEAVEAVLKSWPGLRAVFAEDAVELWLDHEVLPWNKPDRPLISLTPLPSE